MLIVMSLSAVCFVGGMLLMKHSFALGLMCCVIGMLIGLVGASHA